VSFPTRVCLQVAYVVFPDEKQMSRVLKSKPQLLQLPLLDPEKEHGISGEALRWLRRRGVLTAVVVWEREHAAQFRPLEALKREADEFMETFDVDMQRFVMMHVLARAIGR
jgi:hypothetical protein